ncbi:MAG: MoaD/ThiS family protein [Euryarchaeota archaeon]|nr:MoaD/ThiS family protein [Euryarchaeota archaeon]
MRVIVRLFSIVRESCGTERLELELKPDATLGDAVEALRARFPEAEVLSTPMAEGGLLLALNRRHARPDEPVAEGDEIALFPPVSGG